MIFSQKIQMSFQNDLFFLHLAYTTVTFGPLYLFSVITRTTVTTVTSQIVSAVLNHLRESLLMKPSAQSSDPL